MDIDEMHSEVSDYKPHRNPVDVSVIAEHGKCNEGHQMEYRGFKKGKSYRAFAICKICNLAEEF